MRSIRNGTHSALISSAFAVPIAALLAACYDGYASVSVLKGDAYLRVAVGVASNLGPEEALARDALPRM